MHLSPDQIIFYRFQGELAGHAFNIPFNLTMLGTWVMMLLIVWGARCASKKISSDYTMSRWQNFVEVFLQGIKKQVEEFFHHHPERFVPFIGTFFIFILISNLSHMVPVPIYDPQTHHWGHYMPPTSSLSTTIGLTIVVFLTAYYHGIKTNGFLGYLKGYFQPNIFMFPFNIIGQISSFLTLSIRLYGNMMAGGVIAVILLILAPLFFPVVMQAFHILIGVIQAYIFSVLAMSYISTAISGGGH